MTTFSATPGPETQLAAPGFGHETMLARGLARLMRWIEYLCAAVLAADVLVVFLSVIYRYFLHDPFDWAEEVAGALMIVLVFFGAATVLARSQHVGVDLFRGMLPRRWQPALVQLRGCSSRAWCRQPSLRWRWRSSR